MNATTETHEATWQPVDRFAQQWTYAVTCTCGWIDHVPYLDPYKARRAADRHEIDNGRQP